MPNKVSENQKNRIVGITAVSVICIVIIAVIVLSTMIKDNGFVTADGKISDSYSRSLKTEKLTDNFKTAYSDIAYSLVKNFKNSQDNVSFSLSDVERDIAFLGAAAEGETRAEIEKVLKSDSEQFAKSINKLTNAVSYSKRTESGLLCGSTLWINNSRLINVKTQFLKLNGKTFGLDIIRDSFEKKFFSDKVISESASFTNDLVYSTANIEQNDTLAIVSSASYTGGFKKKTDQKLTDGFFGGNGTDSDAKFFKSIGEGYINNEYYFGIKKEIDKNCTILAFMPNKMEDEYYTVNDMMTEMSEEGGLKAVTDKFSKTEVAVTLPYFVTSINSPSTVDLKTAVKELSVKKVFESGADMSGIAGESNINPSVDKITASGDIVIFPADKDDTDGEFSEKTFSSLDKSVTFNRPFIYFICESDSMLPIYFGLVNTLNP